MNIRAIALATVFATATLATAGVYSDAKAATTADLMRESNGALQNLYSTNPAAAAIGRQALAVLVFPNIIKAGFVFGGAYGEGELLEHGVVTGYYNTVTGSWGLQAGVQSYGYVVFLMTPKAVRYLHQTAGWELGVGPTVVVVDAGVARNLSTTTLKNDAYAFIFDQQGLMAGVSIEGTKVTRIHP